MPAWLWLAGLLACAGVLLGCGEESDSRRGSLAQLPIKLGPLGYMPTATLAVPLPIDRRPEIERVGESIHTKLLVVTVVVNHWERRGNYVTNDEVTSPNVPGELHADMVDALRAANVARAIVPGGKTDFELQTEIEHLYGTHYAINQGTVVVVDIGGHRSRSTNVAVAAGTRQYASYGNVVLKARLVDRRGTQPATIWEEHIVGSGQQPPERRHILAAQTAVREAVADALATLVVRVGAAMDRIQRGPTGPAYQLVGTLPPVFLIERVSRYRNFLERVYIETGSGHVLRHEIVPNADPAWGRPGEWLLSRRSPEGIMLSPESYEAYARALATRYDLRTVDDATRYHFFGVRVSSVGTAAPP